MIAYLEGRLLELSEKTCLLVTEGGVGYEVFMPSSALSKLPALGGQAALFVHTVIREDAIDLYGFLSSEDREVFRTLISIDKLGPKKALAILAQFSPEHLREIAFREDDATLATVPGIGPKSARQILWFLKDKVNKIKGPLGKAPARGASSRPPDEYLDALAGLRNLGYSEEEARPLLQEIFGEEPDLDAAGAIRAALKRIASARK